MKSVSIENLLTWAFTEELPKVGTVEAMGPSAAPSSWGALADVIALGTMVDHTPNRYGVVSAFVYQGEPHKDALTVGNRVRALADREGFDVPASWDPFPGLVDATGTVREEVRRIAEEFAAARSGKAHGRHIVSLVSGAAILKRGPVWEADAPKVVTVKRGGKDAWFVKRRSKTGLGNMIEYEDNGFDQRKQRPMKGAYRKYRLAEPIRATVLARLEWQLWQSALSELHGELDGRMHDHELQPFFPNWQPWATIAKTQRAAKAIEKTG